MWAAKILFDGDDLYQNPHQDVVFNDSMRGKHSLELEMEDDIGNIAYFKWTLTVVDTSPPEVWVVPSSAETAEESRATPFFISRALIHEYRFLEESIRSSLRVTDHGVDMSAFDATIWIAPLNGSTEETLATATVEDDVGNSTVARLRVKVDDKIPAVVAINNSTLIASPIDPVLALSEIDQSIRSTADYGDKVIRGVEIDPTDYQDYAQRAPRIGVYPIKYKVRIGLPDGSGEDELLDKVMTVKVINVPVNPTPVTDWDKFVEWVEENGYWIWPTLGSALGVLVLLAIWVNRPRKIYIDDMGNELRVDRKKKPQDKKKPNKKKS